MSAFTAVKPGLNRDIRKDIEILIEENERLMEAAREEISRSTSADSIHHFSESNNLAHDIHDAHPVKEAGVGKSPKEGIFKSIDLMPKKEKQITSYFSRASKIVTTAFTLKQPDEKPSQSLPPPLSLATTFDTEQSSFSDEEERDREVYLTTSDHDLAFLPPMEEFSRMSIVDITTVIEEQKRIQEQIKLSEVQQEQDEIDQALQFLHDGSESGTDMYSYEGTLEWLETEVDHAELISELATEICNDDGRYARGNNTVAIAAQPSLLTTEVEEVESKEPADTMPTSQNEAENDVSPPRAEENPVNDGAVEDENKLPPLMIENENAATNLSNETGDKSLPSPIVEETEIVLINEEMPHLVEQEEEEIPIKAPPPSPVRKSKLVQAVEEEEEEDLTILSIGSDQLPLDPTKEKISVSQLLFLEELPSEPVDEPEALVKTPVSLTESGKSKSVSFEGQLEEPAAEPDDLDEEFDHVEQKTEDPIFTPITVPDDEVAVDKEDIPEPLLSLTKDENASTETQDQPALTEPTTDAPMDELEFHLSSSKPKLPKVRHPFGLRKLIAMVTMACVVVAIGHLSDHSLGSALEKIRAFLDVAQCVEPEPVQKKTKRQHKVERNPRFPFRLRPR